MTCKTLNNKMLLYIDGNLSSNESIKLEEHLHSCEKCKKLFEQVSQTYALINEEKGLAEADKDFASQIWKQVHKNRELKQTPSIIKLSIITTLAAAGIALGVIVGGTFNEISLQNTNTETWEQLADEYFPEPSLDYITSINLETE
ncbi:MAG: zf-HC2 domain-containing protein [Bacteroidales bacterium]|nr:zf-HC2 domain-containing protein [Bacteroidales bacterium]MBN2750238.1 zf-HC2 domain-containing protein [Bacteroidales bacterium]